MTNFHTFLGKAKNDVKDNGLLLERICSDISCKNFKETRAKVIALYKGLEPEKGPVVALVVCADVGPLIGAGIRPATIKHFGNGYSVDVTPSRFRSEVIDVLPLLTNASGATVEMK